MRLRALSQYSDDLDSRFGDCILIYDDTSLVVYDCGHIKHAESVEAFLHLNSSISRVHIIVSHNDIDHTGGIIDLLNHLYAKKYAVTVYSSLYLKSVEKVLEILDDDRRTLPATRQRILQTFDNIKDIVEKSQEYGFSVKDARINSIVSSCAIVGPTEAEFSEVVAAAVENDSSLIEGETVMNAASVQVKCKLSNAQIVLLCGDASPSFMHNLDSYDVIQLPHHGKLSSAQKIFEALKDIYSKIFLVSDNTGSSEKSGGSDKLSLYMSEEYLDPALNTKGGVVEIPQIGLGGAPSNKQHGVKLGEMDYRF